MLKDSSQTHGQEPTNHLIILVGIPGSGKSTLASKYVEQGYVRLSADDIREEWYGSADVQSGGGYVFNELYKRLDTACRYGDNVIVDNTNTTKRGRKHLIEYATPYGYVCDIIVVACPPWEAMQRQDNRERKVPAAVIDRMYEQLLKEFPSQHEINGTVTLCGDPIQYSTT